MPSLIWFPVFIPKSHAMSIQMVYTLSYFLANWKWRLFMCCNLATLSSLSWAVIDLSWICIFSGTHASFSHYIPHGVGYLEQLKI